MDNRCNRLAGPHTRYRDCLSGKDKRRAARPRVVISRFRTLQVLLNELLPRHGETVRQSINFLFAESRMHVLATVGVLGVIDPGPDAASGIKNVFIDLL